MQRQKQFWRLRRLVLVLQGKGRRQRVGRIVPQRRRGRLRQNADDFGPLRQERRRRFGRGAAGRKAGEKQQGHIIKVLK